VTMHRHSNDRKRFALISRNPRDLSERLVSGAAPSFRYGESVQCQQCPPSWATMHARLVDLTGLVDDLDIISVRIKYPGCIVIRMVLQLICRSSLFAATGLDCSIKEGVYLRVALGLKSYVHRSGVRLTRFEPRGEMAHKMVFGAEAAGKTPEQASVASNT
jgi:hypothetical protein